MFSRNKLDTAAIIKKLENTQIIEMLCADYIIPCASLELGATELKKYIKENAENAVVSGIEQQGPLLKFTIYSPLLLGFPNVGFNIEQIGFKIGIAIDVIYSSITKELLFENARYSGKSYSYMKIIDANNTEPPRELVQYLVERFEKNEHLKILSQVCLKKIVEVVKTGKLPLSRLG